MKRFLTAVTVFFFISVSATHAEDHITTLQQLKSNVFLKSESLEQMLEADISARLKAANQKSTAEWRAVQTKTDWETLRDRGINALRKSLRDPRPDAAPVQIHVVGEIKEPGYVIRKIVYSARPELLITANLYIPEKHLERMPGILLSHSHHSPKSQGELQDMGAIWSRAGCVVLVPDHVGHGERRQHPFVSAADYPEKFQVSRQDYHFRYNTAIQLYLAGESLMGCLVRDLMRGVDVLLQQPGVDPQRIALMGGVAGGGDPAAVTGALDSRITLVVPFNFGGPQPETRYPLPDDAETRFDYAGGGSWESTRNLHRSASDGFLPWLIVGSVAPRGLIHAHEFSWDREHDPVWKRYQKIFGFYEAANRLDYTHGYGLLKQTEAEASHCGNIGKPHRQRINAYLAQHWGIHVDEAQPITRHTAAELACLSGELPPGIVNQSLHTLLVRQLAKDQLAADVIPPQRKTSLNEVRNAWRQSLGAVETVAAMKVESRAAEQLEGIKVERAVIHIEREIRLPLLLLKPQLQREKVPVVLLLSQSGKQDVLKQRAKLLSSILQHAAVCLVDLRGIGESQSDRDRGRRSTDTALAASELMLGETLLGARLRDARTTLHYLRTRSDIGPIAILGDNPSPLNASDVNVKRPLELNQPQLAEPLGPTLALLIGLFDDSPLPIAARNGLIDYASLLESQFIHVPFDVIVPGAALNGDLLDVANLARIKHPLWQSGFVTGLNQAAHPNQVAAKYPHHVADGSDESLAKWLQTNLKSEN